MIRWGAIAACLWAGAASAQTVPAASANWASGQDRVAVAEVAKAPRAPRDAAADRLGRDEASGGEGRAAPGFVRFDRQAGVSDAIGYGPVLRLPALPVKGAAMPAELQVEAVQSMAADPQAGQMTHL